MSTRILSGIRPTGHLQLGNYLGAIKQWVSLNKTIDEHYFCVVDQHALTTLEDAENLTHNSYLMAAAYIACGIDPKKSHLFIQSHNPAHTELAWYFSCITPMGWLSRMTQFKDKAGKHKDRANLGLFAYPVLMAADILLYKATHVPVGEDQKQHVELARDIAQAFNNYVGQEFFNLPEPMITKETARIMSLRDGMKKMSKSDPSDFSRINLLDDADTIAQKIKKAKSDTDLLTADLEALEKRPEAYNLVTIYATMCDLTMQDAAQQFDGAQFSALKTALSDVLIDKLSPIRLEILRLMADQNHLRALLQDGADAAQTLTKPILQDVRRLMGIMA